MNKLKKRGSVDVDWAISLAIFIIFLTLFFMFVFPMFNAKPPQSNVIGFVMEKFTEQDSEKSVAWTVSKVLVYVSSTNAGIYPVSLALPYEFSTENSSFFDGRPLLIDENRIFFYHNLKNGSLYLVSSNSTYFAQSGKSYDLTCSDSSFEVSNENMNVDVLNGLITQIDYLGETVAFDFDYGDLAATSSTDFWDKDFVCKYLRGGHSIYPMANSTIIFNYMPSAAVNLKLTLDENHYHSYYDGTAHSIDYGDNTCKTLNTNILDLYDSDGIAFVSNEMSVTMCYNNVTGEKLNLSLQLSNPYKIVLHQGSVLDYLNTRIELGALQKLSGLSYEQLKSLNLSRKNSYDELKSEWGISAANDFDWRVSNKTLQ